MTAPKSHSPAVAVAHYALEGLPSKVLAAEYRTVLPRETEIAGELEKTGRALVAFSKRGRE